MARYYYTDALKAMWMLREFDIKIEWKRDGSLKAVPQDIINLAHDIHHNSGGGGKYYICSDFHEMLKPRIGDLMTNLGVSAWWVVRVQGDKVFFADYAYGDAKEMKIIQRNGKAWFNPEVEGD